LFFHRTDRFAVFSDILAVLLALPEVPREIDEIALADFLALVSREPRRTLYRGIDRTPGRSLVSIDKSGARHRLYWEPNLDAYAHLRREEEYVEQARALFDQAVVAATSGLRTVAIGTSGGLDSSAIAATVARLGRSENIVCYTLVTPPDWDADISSGKYLDENEKVQALGRMYPQLQLRQIVRDRLHPRLSADRQVFASAALPSRTPTILALTPKVWEAALADGHSTVLYGSAGNLGLSWSGDYSLLALLREGSWATFLRELFAVSRQSRRGLARTALSDIVLPGGPDMLRRAAQRLRGGNPDSIEYYSALNPAFIADRGLRRRWRELGFDPSHRRNGWSSIPMRTFRLFDNASVAGDAGSALHEFEGIEIRDPHSDRRLLEFALSVPEWLYRRNGVSRSFARAVFADRLPREILDERRRGANTTPWFRVLDARREDYAMEIERFQDSATARRLLDLPRLRRLLDEWPKDERAAHRRELDYNNVFTRGMHAARFIRWVEGGNG
jgi:asparagine synthase (glutamine-hydrolysing)